MFIFVYSVMKCSNFIHLHIVVQFFQHQLLENYYFSHCIFLPPFSEIRCPWMQGFIAQLSILLHWSILLFLCQCHALWMTIDLYYSLKLHKLIPLALFFILFKKFIYFNWRLITLQYCSGFCYTLSRMSHGFTCVPHPEPLWHLPPHPIPLCHPSAPALNTLSHSSNLDWWSVSPLIIYMFQCYSLRSSHPCLLSQSPKDCSIHLCLFCCLAYGIIIMMFLNPYIWVSILCWCFSFWLTSLRIIDSSFFHLTRTDSNAFFLKLSNIPLCICTTAFLSIHLPMDI